ncbi:MAG: S-adenosylmethionine:tRNA ribosyltransferase-isomerase, partial [Cellvibrionaceae bacterium]
MQIQDFAYDLPESLIAHYPSEKRSGSRLLCLDGPTGECRHQYFTDILSNLQPNDLLIFNNTKVIPARLYAHKLTGGHLEILVERICNNGEAIAHLRSSKSPKIGSDIVLENGNRVRIVGRENALFRLNFGQPVLKLLEAIGHIPLPPYIKRKDDVTDQTRYQTIYGTESGAVAAPTA